MKSAKFDYAAPERLDEALGLLEEHGDDGKILAGGQSLVPLLALRMARFEMLVDINRIDALRGISRSDGELVIGAGTRQAAIERDPLILREAPLIAEATKLIGHFQIRNRGTIGGSLAHADPTAEYPAVTLALDAEVEVADRGSRRRIAIDELLESTFTTTIAAEEMIVAIHVPIPAVRSGHAIEEIVRRPGDFALVGGAATVTLGDDDAVASARVVLFGVEDRAIRLTALEEELIGLREPPSTLEQTAGLAAADLDPPSDVQATGVYRRAVAGPLAARLARAAMTRARAEPEAEHRP